MTERELTCSRCQTSRVVSLSGRLVSSGALCHCLCNFPPLSLSRVSWRNWRADRLSVSMTEIRDEEGPSGGPWRRLAATEGTLADGGDAANSLRTEEVSEDSLTSRLRTRRRSVVSPLDTGESDNLRVVWPGHSGAFRPPASSPEVDTRRRRAHRGPLQSLDNQTGCASEAWVGTRAPTHRDGKPSPAGWPALPWECAVRALDPRKQGSPGRRSE